MNVGRGPSVLAALSVLGETSATTPQVCFEPIVAALTPCDYQQPSLARGVDPTVGREGAVSPDALELNGGTSASHVETDINC